MKLKIVSLIVAIIFLISMILVFNLSSKDSNTESISSSSNTTCENSNKC